MFWKMGVLTWRRAPGLKRSWGWRLFAGQPHVGSLAADLQRQLAAHGRAADAERRAIGGGPFKMHPGIPLRYDSFDWDLPANSVKLMHKEFSSGCIEPSTCRKQHCDINQMRSICTTIDLYTIVCIESLYLQYIYIYMKNASWYIVTSYLTIITITQAACPNKSALQVLQPPIVAIFEQNKLIS